MYKALQEKCLNELDSAMMSSVIDILRPADIVHDQSSTATTNDQSSITGGSVNGGEGDDRCNETERVAEAISILSNYFQSKNQRRTKDLIINHYTLTQTQSGNFQFSLAS